MRYKFVWITLYLQILYFPLFSQALKNNINKNDPFLVILGTIQDGGSPHIRCQKDCCKYKDPTKKIVSLGLVDPSENKKFLIEATPEINDQLKKLDSVSGSKLTNSIDGIFLTHAHIGHYSGLMYLGKEAWNASLIPVFAMPTMKSFLEKNGPWSQLVNYNNIKLEAIENKKPTALTKNMNVTPIKVPHRDEFSETVGYKINSKKKSAIFIPDIDKWSKWDIDIKEMIKEVDYAFIDGTFFGVGELNNRKMEEIPHPLISESMELFKDLEEKNRDKIWFIHLNHSNPALDKKSVQYKSIVEKGFHIASYGQIFLL